MRNRVVVSKFLSPFKRFMRDKGGNVGIIFGVTIIPVFALSLGVLQQGEAIIIKRNMCNAVDAAVLLAAGSPDKSLGYLQGKADHLFKHDFTKRAEQVQGLELELLYSVENDSYSYSAQGNLETPLYTMVGIDSMTIGCRAEAKPKRNGLEIVFALDTTGSMGFGSSWADATHAMANIIPGMQAMTDNSEFFVSFFPFSDRVNIGKSPDKWNSWLGSKTILKKNNGTPKDLEYGHWNGCVQPRPEDAVNKNWTLDDENPSTKSFIPSDKELAFDADDDVLGTGGLAAAKGGWKNNAPSCNAQPILGPTKDPLTIMPAIEDITLAGTGRFDVGMAWAWRMVSPKWRDTWVLAEEGHFGYPSQYGERRKIVVFITDAYTEGYRWEVCDTNGEGNCSVLGNNKGSIKGFENMVDVCTKMKDEGIEIHTVYVNGNSFGVPYLKSCATNVGNYYHEVTNVAELTTTLEKIKSTLSNVRLTH